MPSPPRIALGFLPEPARGPLLTWLRGIGQIMFQGHAGTGLLFLAGVALGSPLVALGLALGAAIGPWVANLARLDRREIEDGRHGFNPALVGAGVLFLLRPTPLTFALLAAGCVAATIVTHLARRHLPFPTYTAPFIVTTWALLLLARALAGPGIEPAAASVAIPGGFLRQVLRGEAEVIFGADAIGGLLFLVGIALSDLRHAALALLGSVAGTLLAEYHADASTPLNLGIYGYNASLAAIAVDLSRPSLLLPLLAALASVPLTEFFPASPDLPALTAPFVLATWLILLGLRAEARFLTWPAKLWP